MCISVLLRAAPRTSPSAHTSLHLLHPPPILRSTPPWHHPRLQTRTHAEWLDKKLGMRAVVLPHPHGNLNGWGISPHAVRRRTGGIGLLCGNVM